MTTPTGSSANEILDEASAWIERRDRESWGAQDQADLDKWLASSPSHVVAFLRAENTWSRTDRLGAVRAQSRQVRRTSGLRWASTAGRSAAALAILGILAAVAVDQAAKSHEKIYTTPVGGHTILALSDGSKIELNTDTKLRVGTSGAGRTVWLDRGEAFFDIKHDAENPFVVLAADHRVTDIGTKFSVRSQGERLEVTLVEGRAKLETVINGGRSHSAVLSRGDVAVALADSISVRKQPQDHLSQSLAWRRGKLVFDNTTLGAAALEFNRYNNHKLIVADAAAAKLTVVGTFHIDDVQAFAEVAEDILHLHAKSAGNETIISR